MLNTKRFCFIVRLGSKSFVTPMWDFNVQLLILSNQIPQKDHLICGIDVSNHSCITEKNKEILSTEIHYLNQSNQMSNPDNRVSFGEKDDTSELLISLVDSYEGIGTGDLSRFQIFWWESNLDKKNIVHLRNSIEKTTLYSGCTGALVWENKKGDLINMSREFNSRPTRGYHAWGKKGLAINRMKGLEATIYEGEKFNCNIATVIPKKEHHLPSIWCYCSSDEFNNKVREIDQALKVTNHTLVKVYNGPQKLDRELRWKTEESKVGLEVFPDEKNTQTIRRRI